MLKSGRIYGRGTEDNNQGLVSAIMAAKAFLDEGIQPEYSLGMAFVADEETGSTYGLQFLVDHNPDIFGRNDLIIVPDAGEPDASRVRVEQKQADSRVESAARARFGDRRHDDALGEILGISEGAVESRLFRAMRRLQGAQESAASGVTR